MDFYKSLVQFCKYLLKYNSPDRNFNGQSYRFKNSSEKENTEAADFIFNLSKIDWTYANFYHTILWCFKYFNDEILDKNNDFYQLTDIDVVYKALYFLLYGKKLLIARKENGKHVITYMTPTEMSDLSLIHIRMLGVFKSNNISDDFEFQNTPAHVSHDEPNFNSNDYSRIDIQLCLSQQAQLLQLFNTLNMNTLNRTNLTMQNSQVTNSETNDLTMISNNSNNKTINTSADFSNHYLQLKNKIRKKVKKEHQLAALKTLKENDRMPPALFYLRLRPPYLPTNAEYMKKLNKLNSKYQTERQDLDIEYIDLEIKDLDKYLTQFKDKVKSSFPDIEDRLKAIQTEIESENMEVFIKKDNKIKDIIKFDRDLEYPVNFDYNNRDSGNQTYSDSYIYGKSYKSNGNSQKNNKNKNIPSSKSNNNNNNNHSKPNSNKNNKQSHNTLDKSRSRSRHRSNLVNNSTYENRNNNQYHNHRYNTRSNNKNNYSKPNSVNFTNGSNRIPTNQSFKRTRFSSQPANQRR